MLIKKLSRAGNKLNEDCATVTSNSAWVLDGATGLSKENKFHKESDAKGLVEIYDNYFKNNTSMDFTGPQLINNAINNFIDFLDLKYIHYTDSSYIPSSGLAMIRWSQTELEYMSLGDCVVLLKLKDGTIKRIYDSSLELLDSQVLKSMQELMLKEGLSYKEVLGFHLDKLKFNRRLKNTKDGYWVLGSNLEASKNMMYGVIPYSDVAEVILATDGFYNVVTLYKLYIDVELFEMLKVKNIEECYEDLRSIENEDITFFKHMRFKLSDDASIIYLNFT